MRATSLWITPVGLHFYCMDQIRKFDRVLDEEHGDIVADKVPVALGCIKFDRKPANVAGGVDRSRSAGNGG